MGTLYLWVEDKLLCPLEDKERCPMIGLKCRKPVFMRVSGICFTKWLYFGSICGRSNRINTYKIFILGRYSVIWNDYLPGMRPKIMK